MSNTKPDIAAPHDPYASLRSANYRDYLLGSFLSSIGRQAVTIAASWEIYQWTHSATALGLVGLVNVLPVLALSLPAGALADRRDRRRIIALAQLTLMGLSAALALLSIFHAHLPAWAPLRWGNGLLREIAAVFERHADPAKLRFVEPALPLMFLLLFAMAGARILAWPARTAIIPCLLPTASLTNGITWNSSASEVANMIGPALGGFLVAGAGFPAVYGLDVVLGGIFCLLLRRVVYCAPPQPATEIRSWRSLLAGVEFIWHKRIIFGASMLDLFATLLGGAIALLPIFADQILHVGPIGLGWLRAAPSIGAFSMAMWIAHHPPMRRPGRILLWAVAAFGASIVVFGFSTWFWLSFLALILSGAFDNVSVVVRQSLVQLLTPDELRGRVTGVNQVFIGSSNELGALRAGLMAASLGAVVSTVFGGICTILVVFAVTEMVPSLRDLPGLHTLRPEKPD
jgi:MFS family permease